MYKKMLFVNFFSINNFSLTILIKKYEPAKKGIKSLPNSLYLPILINKNAEINIVNKKMKLFWFFLNIKSKQYIKKKV